MVISFPAFICLETTWRHILAYAGKKTSSPGDGAAFHANGDLDPDPEPSPVAAYAGAQASRAPFDSEPAHVPVPAAIPPTNRPLSAAERRARAAALRGLTLSRGRRFSAAESAFAEAARLDPALDLTRTPGFWALERAAHEAAITAYLAAGREGDAALLRARVRSTYRPKALRPTKGALLNP